MCRTAFEKHALYPTAPGAAHPAAKADSPLPKGTSAVAVQFLSCPVLHRMMPSAVAQHLPSAVQHDLVAVFFARTIEGEALQGYRLYDGRRCCWSRAAGTDVRVSGRRGSWEFLRLGLCECPASRASHYHRPGFGVRSLGGR
jgi:hypothetical protein